MPLCCAWCRGSDLVESLRLDQRFCMRFVTELTWQTAPGPPAQSLPSVLTQQQQQQQQQQQGRASPGPAAASAAWGGGGLVSGASSSGSSWDDGPLAPVGTGTIRGDAQLDVWCEVIPPFNLMPREVLQVRARAGGAFPSFCARGWCGQAGLQRFAGWHTRHALVVCYGGMCVCVCACVLLCAAVDVQRGDAGSGGHAAAALPAQPGLRLRGVGHAAGVPRQPRAAQQAAGVKMRRGRGAWGVTGGRSASRPPGCGGAHAAARLHAGALGQPAAVKGSGRGAAQRSEPLAWRERPFR